MNNAIPRQNDLNIAAILDDHRWTLRCIFITGCTLSVCVFGRSLHEQHKRKGLGWNNAVIGLSLVFAVVMQVLAVIPVWAESQFIAATAAFVLSKSLSSTYVLLLLRCIGFQVMRPILTYPTIVVVAVAIIANVLGVAAPLVGCVVTETASEASCHPMKSVFLAAIVFDIFKGIWLFTLSAYQVHQLRKSLGPKRLLLSYLFLGLTSTFVRVYALVEIASRHNDLTRDVAAGITWSFLEVNLNVIGACLPMANPSPKSVVSQMPGGPSQAAPTHTPSTSHSTQDQIRKGRDIISIELHRLGCGGVLSDSGDRQPKQTYMDSIKAASTSLVSEAGLSVSSRDYDDTEALRGGPHKSQF